MSALPSPSNLSAAPAAAQVPVHILGSALGAYPGAEIVGVVAAAAIDGAAAAHTTDPANLGPPAGDPAPGTDSLLPPLARPQQLVVVPRLLPCGECEPCRRGRVSVCAQLAARPRRPQAVEWVPARFLVPLAPPFLSTAPDLNQAYRFAALCDGLLAPYSGLVRAGLGPGTLCVIVGHGCRAALAAVVARALGAATVMVCQGAPQHEVDRLLAEPYGVLAVLQDEALAAPALRVQLAALASAAGLPAHGLCFVETSGSDAGRALALSLLFAGATAVLLDRAEPCAPATADPTAAPGPGLAMDLPVGPGHGAAGLLAQLTHEGCTVIGGGAVHPDLLVELLALCERAHVDLDRLTRRVTAAEIDAVMTSRRCRSGDTLTLPVVTYDPPPLAAPADRGATAEAA